nr:NDR1/HIN1-like protein 6 [Solanum lycopersicum]
MIDGYEPLDQSQINGITWSSLSYQTERARKRHIFLQSYKLETYDENSRRTKMKKIVVKMNSVMVSVLSFMWSHTLRTDFYDPKAPIYKFEALDVKEFEYNDSNINADLIITLRADNPNKAIGFIYEEANTFNVTYSGSTICSGKFPSFHHGQKNVTMLQIELKGKNPFAKSLYESLQVSESHGKVPLTILAKVPFRFVFKDSKLRELSILANVTMSVHDMKLGKKTEIDQGKIDYRFVK